MDAAFGNWFAGFVDGEGSFSTRFNGESVYPCFSIGLRADDLPVLEMIQERLEAGHIYHRRSRTFAGYTSQPSLDFQVNTLEGCLRVIDVLDAFPLRAKKIADYLVWREIVKEKSANGPANRDRLKSLRAALTASHNYQEDGGNQDV